MVKLYEAMRYNNVASRNSAEPIRRREPGWEGNQQRIDKNEREMVSIVTKDYLPACSPPQWRKSLVVRQFRGQ